MTSFPFLRSLLAGGVALASVSCADPAAPLPAPSEVVLVVNSISASLSVIPVDAPGAAYEIPLGGTTPTPVGVSASGGYAVVPMGLDHSASIVDLRLGAVSRVVPLANGSSATGSAIVDDSIAYVANPGLNTVTRINYLTGDTASVAVGIYPQGVVATRGKVFVLNGNLVNFAVAGAGWITVIDPVTNAKAVGIDSIPLPLPGNPQFAVVAGDGRIYVMNVGNYVDDGRLSIVDPVARVELANFGGFGPGPGDLATDGGARLFVSSFNEGLMEFDIDAREVVLGAGDGIPVADNSGVAVDSDGRIYAISAGCGGGAGGEAHVLRPDFTQRALVPLGICAIGSAVTRIPAE
ncbi:MAG TPA: hypothetical protein VFV65_00995 [Gemmatimonadales bacterium]|nr:hypothetical protein [Gemmatimonadales bacterium]